MSAFAPASADAAGVLYRRHGSRIFGYCLSLLGSREDAEDAVQTTFVNAQRGLHRGVKPEFELAWLFKIARNVCYSAHASSARRGRFEAAEDLDALQDVLAAPERRAGVSIDELTMALSAVPERQRQALLLREIQGLSYEEISTELGITVPAVETLLHRARRSVAEQLLQPSRARPSGAFASVVAFVRSLFRAGAAPLKIAAATAALATTATLAVSPRQDGGGAATVVTPQATPRAAAAEQHVVGRTQRRSVPRSTVEKPIRTHARPAATTTAAETPAVSSPPPAVRQDSTLPVQTPPAQPGEPSAPPVPSAPVTVPTVSTLVASVPAVTLPTVTVPQVELPAELPTLPDVLKLP